MSYRVYFDFSVGLKKPMRVPKGTLAEALKHVAHVETTLGFETERYLKNPTCWRSTNPKVGVSDELYCQTVDQHNRYVRWLYDRLAEWQKRPPKKADAESLTPRAAQRFWHGLKLLDVPPRRWTKDHYRNRMDHLYEVLRGNESEGVTLGAPSLRPRQAAAVIRLFSEYLDKHDLRLDVPNGHDQLKSSYDGGYTWCEKCGPIDEDDLGICRRRKCPIREEFGLDSEENK